MAKKLAVPVFDDLVGALGAKHFAVAPASAVARVAEPQAVLVSLNGIGAELAPKEGGGAFIVNQPSLLLGGELARLVDHGYQKFFETSHVKVPATADALRAVHQFTEALTQAVGGQSLYNEALGTVSDVYVYDRLRGRG